MTVLEFINNNYNNTNKKNVCKYCSEYQALGICSSLLCERKPNRELDEMENENIFKLACVKHGSEIFV